MNKETLKTEYELEREKNSKKLKLINRLEYIESEGVNIKKFVKFYYDNLDLELDEALDLFNKNNK